MGFGLGLEVTFVGFVTRRGAPQLGGGCIRVSESIFGRFSIPSPLVPSHTGFQLSTFAALLSEEYCPALVYRGYC